MMLARQERFEEATAAFRQAVRLRPDSPDFLNNLGNTLLRQQKSEEAVSCFLQAVQARPEYPLAHCNLGSALLEQGKVEEAITRYREALRLRPDYLDAHFNLGNAYRKSRRHGEALACYARVLELQPEHLGARLNAGVTHTEEGRLDEGVAIFEEIQRRKPDFAEAYNCLGIARLQQRRSAEALAQFDQGVLRKPDDAEVHLNRALCLLLRGEYEAGWQEYEWRWKLKKATPRPHPQPTWDGSALPRGAIILWGEQGMGDILQFIRYAPLVKERVGTVLLDCPGPLRGLLANCPGVDVLVGGNAGYPAPDVQAPLLSLPRILGTTLATVPASVPYLFADAPQREPWRQRAAATRGLKVGIVWQGNPLFVGDRFRSARLSQFGPLAGVPGVHLYSLQKGQGSEQLAEPSAPPGVTDWGALITGDYRDTAAAILNLDLVVSVDTSVAHLAGALGVPVWVLVPYSGDWRWLEDRTDSVWYPTARLFRQTRWGDWDEVFGRVARALHEQARLPALRRVPLRVDPAELVERLAAGGPRSAAAEEALRDAGLLERAGLARHTARLESAYLAVAGSEEEMLALAPAADLDAHAAGLVRRFADARRERDDALAELSAWLAGEARPVANGQS
jgi:tetratricopeptide (TPR) repeat protein